MKEEATTERIAALLDANDTESIREALMAPLAQTGGAAHLRELDEAKLLTRIIPELEPARATDQPHVHFLPVLAHMLETATTVEWLLGQVATDSEDPSSTNGDSSLLPALLPVAVQTYPELRYQSIYADELRRHFAEQVGGRFTRATLFKLAALLHDIAKPQTKETRPDGSVSFHEHQTIGGEIALRIARRMGFNEEESSYIRTVVREHMRPGQLAFLDEITPRAVERFFRATGDAGPDVLVHLLADHMATRGPWINAAAWRAQAAWIDALLDSIWGEEPELTRPLLNGNELMRALGIGPGPQVGRLLAAVGEAQAGGEIATREEAIALAKKLARSA